MAPRGARAAKHADADSAGAHAAADAALRRAVALSRRDLVANQRCDEIAPVIEHLGRQDLPIQGDKPRCPEPGGAVI